MLWMLALCSTGVVAQGQAFNANPNTAIPDNSNVGADSTITVPNAAPYNTHAIGALQIGLRINHTRNDNLDIYLVPPGVTWNRTGPTYNTGAIPAGVIELSTDNGGTNDNYGSGAGPYTYARLSNTIDPVFTSTQAIAAGTVPYTANIYTVEDTTDFNLLYRSSPVGNWKLVVIDDGNSGQNGTLISWEVRYLPQYYADPNVAIPDNNPNGATSSINVPATSELVGSFQLGLRVTHGNCQHLDVYLLPPWVSASAPYTYAQSQFSGGAIDRPADDGVVEVSTDLGGANFGTGVLAPFAIAYCRVTAQGDGLFTGAVAPISGGGATGRFLAEGVRALHDIYGRSPAGTWTLVLCDDQAGTAGTLVSWQIIYEPVGPGNLSVQRGISDLTYSSIKSGQIDQVLAQFRFDAVGAADNLTSLSVQHTDGVNFSAQFSQLKLVRDNNGDGLYDGGDSLLATQAAPASATVTFGFSQALAANSGVDLLVLGDMLASPVPATRVAVQISAAASVTGSLPRIGIFPVLAGPNIIENIRTFTYRPGAVQSVTDNDPNGVARSIVVGPTSERIRGLRVGVRLDHAYTGDLDLWLLPPGVTWQPPYASLDNGPVLVPPYGAVELSTKNGGGGDNYGISNANGTLNYVYFSSNFDPDFPTTGNITTAASPFAAAAGYNPEGLDAFNRLYGTSPAGTWTLIMVDGWGQDVGHLVSWRVEYTPITTPQLFLNVGEGNVPGTPATFGATGQVFGQYRLDGFLTAGSVSQLVLRETNGATLTANVSALRLYADNNNDGALDGGDTLLSTAALAGSAATFNLVPALNVPNGGAARVLVAGDILAAPTAATLGFRVNALADISSAPATTAPFPVRLGDHPLWPPNTFISTTPGGRVIPDNSTAGLQDTITIPATTNLIGALRVGIRVDHAGVGDLDIYLVPPGVAWAGPFTTVNNGVNVTPPAGVIELSTDNGGAGDNFGSGSPTFTYTVFSSNNDRRFSPGATLITGGTAPYTAASGYRPEGLLAFEQRYGTSPAGNWTLVIADDNGTQTGRLLSWFIQYVPAERVVVSSTPTPGFASFGNVLTGSSSVAQNFVNNNAGEFDLTVTSVVLSGAHPGDFSFVAAPPTGLIAGLGASPAYGVVFTPTTTGLRTANITVTYNTSTALIASPVVVNYAISGVGVTPIIEVRETNSVSGALVANGAAAANGRLFGSRDIAAGATAALTIFVNNTGSAALTLGAPTLGGANPGDFVMNLTGLAGSVAPGGSTSFTVAFDPLAAGARSATVSFTHNGSNTASPFTFSVSGTGFLPTLTIASSGSPSEVGATGTYTITATPAPQIARTVNFTMSGSAQTAAGADYNLAPLASFGGVSGTVTLGLSGSVVITLTPVNDARVEATESATFTLNAGTDYTVGAPASASLDILDNDDATVTVTASGSPAEGGGSATYTIATGATLEIPLSVNFSMSGLAAFTAGGDYTLAGAASFSQVTGLGTVTLAIGTGSSANVTLTVVNDTLVEGPEDAVMTLAAGTKYVLGAPASASRTLADNDVSVITMSRAGTPNETGPAGGTYTITATPQPVYAMSVNLLLSGTATLGGAQDYTITGATFAGSGPWTAVITIPGGGAAGVNVGLTLNVNDDARVEATETVNLAVTADTLSSDPAYSGTPSEVHNILDNDTAVVVVTSSGSPSEAGPTAGSYTISTTSELETPLTINFNMGGAAATAPGTDYNISGGTYAGPAGTATLPVGLAPFVVVTLTPVVDLLVEGNEIATLTLAAGSQYSVGAPASANLTIIDNDFVTVTVSASGTPGESGATGTFTVSTTANLALPVVVNFSMSGLADVSADYVLSGVTSYGGGTGTVTLAAGPAPSVIVTLTPVNDADVEGPEDAQLSLTAGSGYSLGAPFSAQLSIADNDVSVISIVASGSPSEAGPVHGQFTLSATPAPVRNMLVNFQMSGAASFAASGDYTLLGVNSFSQLTGAGTVIIGAGGSVVVTLSVTDDSVQEPTENATLTVTPDSLATDPAYSGTPNGSLSILDNDTPVITVVGGPLAFGGIEPGAASAAQSYSVSGVFLSADIVVTAPADFQVALALGGPWLSGLNLTPTSGSVSSTTVYVRFVPTSLGAAGGNVSNASTGAATQNVAVSGTGEGIVTSGGPLAFGSQLSGTQSAAQSYTVQAQSLAANLLITPPTGFQVALAPGGPWQASLNLGSGNVAATTIHVRFAPASAGAFGGNVSNASTGYTTRNIAVSGTGTAASIVISGLAGFGNQRVTTSSAAQAYSISNPSGSAPLNITALTFAGANPGDFAFVGLPALPTSVGVGGSLNFSVVFTPSAAGSRAALIRVNNDNGGMPFKDTDYAISGFGTAPVISVSPVLEYNFGNQRVGSASAPVAYTVTNTGDAPLNLRGVTLSGTNPGSFSLSGTTSGVIAPSANVQFTVSFGPATLGLHTATLNIDSDSAGGPAAVTLTYRDVRGTGTAPSINVTPNIAQNFGNQRIGTASAPIVYTIQNLSTTDALNVRSVAFNGTGTPAAFALSGTLSGLVPPGNQIQFSVVFQPSATGPFNAQVEIDSDSGGTTSIVTLTQRDVQGNGAAPVISVSGTQSFGSGIVGVASPSSPITYSVNNTGNAPLEINAISIVGSHPGDFSLSAAGLPALVPAGGPAYQFTVSFVATATGPRLADIRLMTDGGQVPLAFVPTLYAVDGNGTAGLLSISGTQNFGSTPVTVTSPTSPITYTITNTAVGPTAGALTVNSVTLGGSHPGDFSVLSTSVALPTVLAPGQSFTADVSFTPTVTGLRQANLVVNSNSGGAPFGNTNYALSGTGTAGLFAAMPSFPTQIDHGGPVIVHVVISSIANTVADVVVEYTGGTQGAYAPAFIARTNLGTISGNVIQGLNVTPGGITLEIQWDAYASEGHTTASNYRLRFTPQNGLYGQGTQGVSGLFTLARQGGFAQHVIPGDQLTGRYGHTMIYDEANDRLILFGGRTEFSNANDVWAYDFSGYFAGWHKLQPAGTPPSGRQLHAAIYDAPRNRMIVHGGYPGSPADVWQLTLTRGSEAWTQLNPTGTAPSARYCQSMVFDAARNRALIFGGYNGANLNDVWQLSLALGAESWSQIIPAGTAPSPRYGSHAVVDVARDRMVVYGGDPGAGSSSTQVFALSLAPGSEAWTPIVPAAPQGAPAGRFVGAFGYVGNRESLLVVGGYTSGYRHTTDAWLLDLSGGETWVPLSDDVGANQGRAHGSAVYDAGRGRMVVFGGLGYQGTARHSMSFLSTSGTPTWSLPAAPQGALDSPTERWGASMVFDTRYMPSGRVVTFGGSNSTANTNDSWWIDPAAASPAWQRLNPAGTLPPVRGFASSVFDGTPGVERMIVYGGQAPSGAEYDDVWTLDLSSPGSESWAQVSVSGGPGKRYGAAAIWEDTPGSERLIIQGGYRSGLRFSDTWALSFSPTPTWTQLATTGTPPAHRVGHGALFDSANRRLVIACGTGGGAQFNDVWALDLNTLAWANISAVSGSVPPGREYAAYAADASGSRLWMFGGRNGNSYINDFWQLDVPGPGSPATWTQIAPAGPLPVARRMASATMLPSGRFLMAFGFVGITPDAGASDVWQIEPTLPTPRWQRVDGQVAPRGLVHAAEAYDAGQNRMIVFGGLQGGVLSDRLWQLDLSSPAATWTELATATINRPDGRRGAKFVYDPNGGSPRLLMYGGRKGVSTASICDELWQLTLSPGSETWTLLSPGAGPPPLADYSVVYDAASNAALYFGGQLTGGGSVNTLWRLSLGASPAWTQLTPASAPPARYAHSAVLDPLGNRMIVFGGYRGATAGTAELWSYNLGLNAWTQHFLPAPVASSRYYHSAVYDGAPGQERMIVLAGYSSMALSDGWQLDLRAGFPLAWSALPRTAALPQPRWGHSVVFDTIGQRMVIAGGYVDGEYVATQERGRGIETWFYGR